MIDRLGWTLLHFVWEGALVALALALVLPFVRRSARARYALACLALGCLVAAPLATYRALAPAASFVVGPSRVVATPGQAYLAEAAPYQPLLPSLVTAWAFGVAVLSVRLGARLVGIERWRRRHARPVEPEWQERVDALARGMGIRRAIRVLVSDRIAVPSAWGVLRAVIVLPSSLLAGLSPAQVETILLHELAHIRRHDYLVNLLQAVVETVLFYHPAVWWVSGVVRREREHCCDDAVVARLGDPMPYARALLHLEERRHGLPRPTLSAKEGNLMNRIARILTPQPAPAPARVSPLASSLAALGVLGAILGGTLQAQAQSKPPAPKKKPAVAAKPMSIRVRVTKPAHPLHLPVTVRPSRVTATVAPPAPSIFRWVPAQAAIAPAAPLLPPPAPVTKTAIARPPVLAPIPATGRLKGSRAWTIPVLAPPPQGTTRTTTTLPAAPPAQADEERVPAATDAFARDGFGGQGARGGGGGLGGGATTNRGYMSALGGFGGGGLGGGGFGRSGADEVRVEEGSNGTVTVDASSAPLAVVLRQLARTSKLSIVIEAGDYRDVTMVLTDQPTAEAITILCRAANATFRKEGSVYYIVPRGS